MRSGSASKLVLAAVFLFFACRSQEIVDSERGEEQGFEYTQESGEAELKLKIAQMLMVGFRGTELDEENPICADITESGIGGVILFDYDMPSRGLVRNVTSKEQLTALCAALQAAAASSRRPPLFIGSDQEGGRVSRLKERNGFSQTPQAAQLGKGSGEETREAALATASLLGEMGINVNFAPCVDLNLNPRNPIIGRVGRSFSSDPAVVVKHAAIWIEAHNEYDVFSCVKHFPGHGSSLADTHKGAVDISETWIEDELIPYRELAGRAKPVPFVMTSHVFNSRLDGENPATLSKKILTDLLRGEIGFDGIIVSDDLDMAAIKANYGFEEALEKAVNAGVNILCFSNNGGEFDPYLAGRVIETVYRLVREGRVGSARIEESYRRIMALKARLAY
jgi:beta-N-acetylhexosaminidase